MPAARKNVTPEQMADGRYRYEQTNEPVRDIAADLGMSVTTFHCRATEWGWKKRTDRVPRVSPPPVDEEAPAPATGDLRDAAPAPLELPDDGAPLAVRVQRAVERELLMIEKIIASLGGTRRQASESERAARALASLARTLRELNALQAQMPGEADADDESKPRDIEELRRELVRRMDALVAGRTRNTGGEPEQGRD
jgi:hypothetical protein